MAVTDEREERWLWRARLAAVCLLLTGVAFRQAPGLVVTDTKVDLTANPMGLLVRALHLWDPHGAFGQLQNQAYGYLFPMGPFHVVLDGLGVPSWVVGRLWWSVLLCVAFLGMYHLSDALRLGHPWLRMVAAVCYALSPRIAAELTVTSVEVWPMAVAPWVLAPLVAVRTRSWWWRISRSAVAFAFVGGVNAVATGAVLVLPALWFLTRRPSRAVASAFAGWLAAVSVVSLWWLGPLLVLGRYSPPFLDWIESASITTSTASPFESLRGSSAWLGFLATATGPEWPGGWTYVTEPVVIVMTTILAALGLLGLALGRGREQGFLVVAMLVGVALLTMGHLGATHGAGAAGLQVWLDGPLAAFRNAHKFDLVARIPLSLALVPGLHLVGAALRDLAMPRWLPALMVGCLIAGAAAPSIVASLPRDQAYPRIPAYWSEAAAWLDAQETQGAVLALPATSFADFVWGSTKDDPLQAIMRRPLVVRDAVPLGSAGATRLLDGIVRGVATGRADASLERTLASNGVAFVVMRNDLLPEVTGGPGILVRSALQASGMRRVATFGPASPNLLDTDDVTVDYRTRGAPPMIEVYAVAAPTTARLQAETGVVGALAGPEDATRLRAAVGNRLMFLGTDATTPPTIWTDGLRRREVDFGRATDNVSPTLTGDETPRQKRPTVDYVADPGAPVTVTRWAGIRGIRGSSSASDVDTSLRTSPANRPGAAVDSDPTTRWISGRANRGIGEWLQVDLLTPTVVPRVELTLSDASPVRGRPTRVAVATEVGSVQVPIGAVLGPISISLPSGPTRWVRVTLEDAEGATPVGFSVAELQLAGITPDEQLVIPARGRPDLIVMGRQKPGPSGCVRVDDFTSCSPTLDAPLDEPARLSRVVTLDGPEAWTFQGEVRAVANARTDSLLDFGSRSTASASSRLVDSLVDRPGAVLDRDLSTAWIAGRDDFGPTMTVRLPERRRISAMTFTSDPRLAASGPKVVEVTADDGRTRTIQVDEQGVARFAPFTTRELKLRFGATWPIVNVDGVTGERTFLPVGFSELVLDGADDLRQPLALGARTGAPCGLGPSVSVNGTVVETEVVGTVGDLAFGRPLQLRSCGSEVQTDAGEVTIHALPSVEFRTDSLVWSRVQATPQPAEALVELASTATSSTTYEVTVPSRSTGAVLAFPINANAGWTAHLGGRDLESVRVDGWQQGWRVPAGVGGTVVMSFAPDSLYRFALLLGWVLPFPLWWVVDRRLSRQCPRSPAVPLRSAVAVPVLLGLWALVVGGWLWGLVAVAVAVWGTWTSRDRSPFLSGFGVAATISAGILVAFEPWPLGRANLDSVLVQDLVLTGVLSCALVGLRRAWGPAARGAGPSA